MAAKILFFGKPFYTQQEKSKLSLLIAVYYFCIFAARKKVFIFKY